LATLSAARALLAALTTLAALPALPWLDRPRRLLTALPRLLPLSAALTLIHGVLQSCDRCRPRNWVCKTKVHLELTSGV
jgi:hypothetical protein